MKLQESTHRNSVVPNNLDLNHEETKKVIEKQRGFFVETLNLQNEVYTMEHFESDLYSTTEHVEFWHTRSSMKLCQYTVFDRLENWKELNLNSFPLSQATECNKKVDELAAKFYAIAIRDNLEIIRQNTASYYLHKIDGDAIIRLAEGAKVFNTDLSYVGIRLTPNELINAIEQGKEIEFEYGQRELVKVIKPKQIEVNNHDKNVLAA